jgi:DNA mismatch repair protein MLH3
VRTAICNLRAPNKGNSAYLVNERPIPSVSQQPPNLLSLSLEHLSLTTSATQSSGCVGGPPSSIFDPPSTWCLQKDDLKRMKVISQLDRKFILCAVDPIRESDDSDQASNSLGRMLVLVDQHAASERVRVEGFLKTLCHNFLSLESVGKNSANRVELDPPRPILLSRKEASILRDTWGNLERWCFDLSWPESKRRDQSVDRDAYERVLVHGIPHVVGDKVR